MDIIPSQSPHAIDEDTLRREASALSRQLSELEDQSILLHSDWWKMAVEKVLKPEQARVAVATCSIAADNAMANAQARGQFNEVSSLISRRDTVDAQIVAVSQSMASVNAKLSSVRPKGQGGEATPKG